MGASNLMELRKFVAPEFIFGSGARNLAGRYARNLGAQRVLVVTDPGVMSAGWANQVTDSLKAEGITFSVYSQVTSNPRAEEVMAGAQAYLSEGCNAIVAVGGGSPMDCAKGIGIVSSCHNNVLAFEGVDEVPNPGPPLICIPTTAGSSADVSQFAIITDISRKVKIAIVSKSVVPDVALIDPVTTTTMDAGLTACTGMDALVHAVEAYVSNANSPITDLHALEAIRLVSRNLVSAIEHPDDNEIRARMMLGSLLAGLAFSNASLGAVHAMAHSLGGLLDFAHGEANAILLTQIPSGRIIDANMSACSKFGHSLQEMTALSMHDLLPGETAAQIEACYAGERIPKHGGDVITTRLRRPDDNEITVEMTVRPVSFGETRYAVIVARDVTDRVKAEEERSKLEGQILQLQKMETVGLLAGGIAHDFNNLLTPILGFTEILISGLTEGDPRREQMRHVKEAAERARDLTSRLLTFSRKQIIELKTVDLGDIIERFENMLRRTIRENISIEVRIAPSTGLVLADAGQIEQVLVNLSINAQDAMQDGGVLTIEAKDIDVDEAYAARYPDCSPGAFVMLAVSDTGSGMEKNIAEHIFEPFFTTKEPGSGTGLGLSTVYGIIKQHGGFISVYSERNVGSTFKIFLPRVMQKGAAIERKPDDKDRVICGSETVLVVEDNEMVRTITSEMLEALGYKVIMAENSEDCANRLKEYKGHIDLLLTDVIMPKMNGSELFDQLSATHTGLKVLFMSGYPSNAIGHHGVLAEGMHFIQKPFSMQSLSVKIRQVLDS